MRRKSLTDPISWRQNPPESHDVLICKTRAVSVRLGIILSYLETGVVLPGK